MGIIGLACWAGTAGTSVAETRLFTFDLPADRPVTYEVPLEVRHPGSLAIRAEWNGPRTLSLRLDRPGRTIAVARRSGPSPQTLEVDVAREALGPGDWRLTIHALSGRDAASATLTVSIPGPEPKRAAPPPPEPPPPRPHASAPWMIARVPSAGDRPGVEPLIRAVERYRQALESARDDGVADGCRWQDDLMRYLAARRDDAAGRGGVPIRSTRRMLDLIADAIDRVNGLRVSRDPLIVGPAPENRERRELWERLRRERFRDVEWSLDEILESLERDHAPELGDQSWPSRLITCLAACERHFEERGRIGEAQAINLDLAQAQWPRMLEAGRALRALADTPGLDRNR